MYRQFLMTAALSCAVGGAAFAECASEAEITAFVDSYLAKTPAKALGAGGTMEDALCTQAKLVEALSPHLGPVVGYKAALTSAAMQERFKVDAPLHGVLYRDMLLEDGAEVPTAFGAIPMLEADLLLVIGSDAINTASSPEEAISHISEVRPFIELPDPMAAKGEPITGETLTAMGVAPRLGVMGAGLPVDDPAAMLAALEAMSVTLTASDGTLLAEAPGSVVLGNPVNSVLWLVSAGITLKAGDIVSVGSIGPLMPAAKAGGGATATYTGLPGDPSVSVRFTQ
ncbi:fumarylacetoacetate hydrolase family protein [Salipiger bermudensis]|uniref:2-keto-4-pentenoate hydratase n=1 Tax=Salipiger bermudensis TaxID=344736 RepID=UPI001C9931E0|nr:fumarylacetoacetate hydrolase family protein [Salipiger bermudensis]MBY6002584.1 fumarylacetoacetate hydrolase family protein [Salipiger bermudensis]